MPKGSVKRWGVAAKEYDTDKYYSKGSTNSKDWETGREKARIRIGDENLKALDAQKRPKRNPEMGSYDPALDPVTENVYSTEAEDKRKRETENRKYEASQKRKVQYATGKSRALEAGKARIKDDFSEAVEMVKKKKTTNRSAY